jgi:hypothetical protein
MHPSPWADTVMASGPRERLETVTAAPSFLIDVAVDVAEVGIHTSLIA